MAAMRLTPINLEVRLGAFRLLALAVLLTASAQTLAVEDPCAGYKWDVSKERALFGGVAVSAAAGKDSASAPRVTPNRLYQLQLLPASQVSFPVSPGKTPGEGTYAGIFSVTVPAAGSYRVAIDLPLWIDVVANGKLLPAADFEGQHDCSAPRKIVEFALDGSQPLTLQLSAASQATVRLTITAVPKG
jgi:hypothetical protein